MKSKLTEAQILLAQHLKELGFVDIEHEFYFHKIRKWRADIRATFRFREKDIYWCLFECDGMNWKTGQGHRRGKALEADYEKQNWAMLNGFKVLRFSNRQILTGEAKKWLQENL